MSLRLMQVSLPAGTKTNIEGFLEGRKLFCLWKDTRDDGGMLFQLIVPAADAEPIMDKLEQRFTDTPGFQIVLLPAEAVLPAIDDGSTEGRPNRPKTTRVSRAELSADIDASLGTSRLFVVMVVLSAIVAGVGLFRNDLAVIIGAMVIAPLLGPNVALALATALGDTKLAQRALVTNLIGVSLTMVMAMGVGALLPVDPEVPAIAARTQVHLSDIALALAAGAAGTLAYTTGLSGTVIGVMVAVALMPPLVTAGLLFGAGHGQLGLGALLLTAANVICVNLAGVVTFLLQGVRPRSWWDADRAGKAARSAVVVWVILLSVLIGVLYLADLQP